jgi:hypothetical protein
LKWLKVRNKNKLILSLKREKRSSFLFLAGEINPKVFVRFALIEKIKLQDGNSV